MPKEKKEETPRILKNVFHEPELEVATVSKSELDELKELDLKLKELGITRISQLENKIAELSK